MHLITGKVGTDHITSANDGFKNAHVFGDGSFVFNEGGSFTATKIDNNTVRIGKGQGYIQGRLFEMTTYEEVNILSGTESFNRCDLIVARYEKDANTQLESIRLVAIAGERTASGFVPPEYIEGDILAGDLIADFPLCKVNISGLEIDSIVSVSTIVNVKDLLTLESEILEIAEQSIPESIVRQIVDEYVEEHQADLVSQNDFSDYQTQVDNKFDVVDEDIDDLKEDIESQEKALEKTDKSLEALWKLNKGQTYDFYTETKTSHIDDVTSGGRYASIDVLGGKSVVWNQCINVPNTAEYTYNGLTISKTNGVIKVNGTATANTDFYYSDIFSRAKHKFLFLGCPNGGSSTTFNQICDIYEGSTWKKLVRDTGSGAKFVDLSLYENPKINVIARVLSGVTVNNIEFKPCFIDLTQMFGAGNEPTTTTDERIKAIEKYAEENPAYNVGEIISNPISEIKSVGKNLWDEEWENGFYSTSTGEKMNLSSGIRSKNTIKINPDNSYYIVNGSNVNVYIFAYKSDNTFIDCWAIKNVAKTFPATTDHITIALYDDYGATYKNDVAIIKGTSGTYSPYHTDTIEIPEAITSLDGYGIGINDNCYNSIEFDGDKVYFHKRVGVVDLGSLSWIYNARGYFMAEISDIANWDSNSTVSTKIICNNYYNGTFDSVYAGSSDLTISQIQGGKKIGVVNTSYTDATTFKNAMASQNAKLYYELATEQITDITDLYTNDSTLECEGNGTLTYIGENDMPIPHTMTFIRKLDEVQ